MKSIFAFFDDYQDAEEAVGALLAQDFEEEAMNVIIREQVAKQRLDVNLHKVDVRKTDEVGEKTVRGLTELLGGEQPVHLPGVGEVLAAGELATNAAKTASASWAPEKGLKEALMELNVPEDVAEAYRQAIDEGGLLFWIRTDDERAPAAASALRSENAKRVADYAGNAPIR